MAAPRPLPPCTRRSCVSTQAPRTDPLRRIEPLAHAADRGTARSAVLTALGRIPRLRVLERDDRSVHAVVRSAWLRVPTDIELRIDVAAVHLRVSTPFALRERSGARSLATALLGRVEAELRDRADR